MHSTSTAESACPFIQASTTQVVLHNASPQILYPTRHQFHPDHTGFPTFFHQPLSKSSSLSLTLPMTRRPMSRAPPFPATSLPHHDDVLLDDNETHLTSLEGCETGESLSTLSADLPDHHPTMSTSIRREEAEFIRSTEGQNMIRSMIRRELLSDEFTEHFVSHMCRLLDLDDVSTLLERLTTLRLSLDASTLAPFSSEKVNTTNTAEGAKEGRLNEQMDEEVQKNLEDLSNRHEKTLHSPQRKDKNEDNSQGREQVRPLTPPTEHTNDESLLQKVPEVKKIPPSPGTLPATEIYDESELQEEPNVLMNSPPLVTPLSSQLHESSKSQEDSKEFVRSPAYRPLYEIKHPEDEGFSAPPKIDVEIELLSSLRKARPTSRFA